MGTLTDDDLRQLLGEAAASFEVPADGPDAVVSAHEERPVVVGLRRRRLLQLSSAASVVVLALVAGLVLQGRHDGDASAPLAAAGPVSAGGDASGGVTYTGMQPRAGRTALQSGAKALPAPAAGPEALAPLADTALRGAPSVPAAPGAVDGARVVKKGTVGLLVDDGQVTPTLTRVQGYATAAGGLVALQESQEAGETPSGSVTLRVPVAGFERLVAQVRSAAPEVSTATTSGQDVTAQYADLEAQLTTLKAARERFLVILGRADSIGDVLSVQQRVDDVSGKIDRLEGQRRVLAAQSDTATLEVTVTERDDPSVQTVVEPDTGLSKALRDARDGFVHGVEALVRWSGPALLGLLLLAAAYGLARVGRRAVRRRAL